MIAEVQEAMYDPAAFHDAIKAGQSERLLHLIDSSTSDPLMSSSFAFDHSMHYLIMAKFWLTQCLLDTFLSAREAQHQSSNNARFRRLTV
jgi:hypothetical protein